MLNVLVNLLIMHMHSMQHNLIYNWRVSEAGETLSGLFNRESRIYIYIIYIYMYIVRANFVLITRKEGGA